MLFLFKRNNLIDNLNSAFENPPPQLLLVMLFQLLLNKEYNAKCNFQKKKKRWLLKERTKLYLRQ